MSANQKMTPLKSNSKYESSKKSSKKIDNCLFINNNRLADISLLHDTMLTVDTSNESFNTIFDDKIVLKGDVHFVAIMILIDKKNLNDNLPTTDIWNCKKLPYNKQLNIIRDNRPLPLYGKGKFEGDIAMLRDTTSPINGIGIKNNAEKNFINSTNINVDMDKLYQYNVFVTNNIDPVDDNHFTSSNNKGGLCFVGGYIEENETPFNAIIRELKEETGNGIIYNKELFKNDLETSYVNLNFTCRLGECVTRLYFGISKDINDLSFYSNDESFESFMMPLLDIFTRKRYKYGKWRKSTEKSLIDFRKLILENINQLID